MSRLATLITGAQLVLPPGATETLEAYADLIQTYNARLNLVARTDVRHLAERHVLHAIALARRPFPLGARVVDWGTGGGLPLIPLAVAFPDVHFTGVDSVEKKVLAVRAMARALGLPNVEAWYGRAETYSEPHAYSVSRATAPLDTLWQWHLRGAVGGEAPSGAWPPGLVCLKGGSLTNEVGVLRRAYRELEVTVEPVGLTGSYFADKHVVTVQAG